MLQWTRNGESPEGFRLGKDARQGGGSTQGVDLRQDWGELVLAREVEDEDGGFLPRHTGIFQDAVAWRDLQYYAFTPEKRHKSDSQPASRIFEYQVSSVSSFGVVRSGNGPKAFPKFALMATRWVSAF